jgi:hypothetical protein
MILNNSPDPRPLGVLLGDLENAIHQSDLEASRDGNSLIVRDRNLITRIDLVPPAQRECGDAAIKAAVQIKTELPKEIIGAFLTDLGLVERFNAMATLGSLTVEKDACFIGSRLTVYEQENASKLHFRILLFSTILAADSFLGAIRRVFFNEEPLTGASAWTKQDLDLVESYLSKICLCSTGGLRLTAEFSLRRGKGSAVFGDRHTALWRIFADQPHPALGGGLLCLLELPHRIVNESRIDPILNQLNQKEMVPEDLPPHFGAWCRGNLENNPAYVAFFPNVMRFIGGIAINASIWALHRAEWADTALASFGVNL